MENRTHTRRHKDTKNKGLNLAIKHNLAWCFYMFDAHFNRLRKISITQIEDATFSYPVSNYTNKIQYSLLNPKTLKSQIKNSRYFKSCISHSSSELQKKRPQFHSQSRKTTQSLVHPRKIIRRSRNHKWKRAEKLKHLFLRSSNKEGGNSGIEHTNVNRLAQVS